MRTERCPRDHLLLERLVREAERSDVEPGHRRVVPELSEVALAEVFERLDYA